MRAKVTFVARDRSLTIYNHSSQTSSAIYLLQQRLVQGVNGSSLLTVESRVLLGNLDTVRMASAELEESDIRGRPRHAMLRHRICCFCHMLHNNQ